MNYPAEQSLSTVSDCFFILPLPVSFFIQFFIVSFFSESVHFALTFHKGIPCQSGSLSGLLLLTEHSLPYKTFRLHALQINAPIQRGRTVFHPYKSVSHALCTASGHSNISLFLASSYLLHLAYFALSAFSASLPVSGGEDLRRICDMLLLRRADHCWHYFSAIIFPKNFPHSSVTANASAENGIRSVRIR